MSEAEVKRFESILKAKQAELRGSMCRRDEIAVEKTPDALDEVQLAGERELAIRNLHRESHMLRQIRFAIARIGDGSYGICLHCEEEISARRIQALPWAVFCIRCQEQADKNETWSHDAGTIFANAA
jgi:DnaK suppressor protein